MSRVYCCGSKHCDRPRRVGGEGFVGLRPKSLPRWIAVTGCCERGAEGNILAAYDLHDGPDRVHNDLWLVDRDNMTGLLSRDQTSSF
jgi:hypothetical protein